MARTADFLTAFRGLAAVLAPLVVAAAAASLLGMATILTVSPRSLAAGGVEVTDRATGARETRPLEDVEALVRGG